ncbi:MAG TPA: hypothetical protein VGO51_03490 [Burkholderiaceae bacterium]|nr:hypothetical protein [Burkholderiaceae bacterium]
MWSFAAAIAFIIAAIVCGPSNSNTTLFPAIKGLPVAASSSAASAAMSVLALRSRFARMESAFFSGKAPWSPAIVGVGFGVGDCLRYLMSGRDAQSESSRHMQKIRKTDDILPKRETCIMHDAIAVFLLPYKQNSYLQTRIIDERQYIDLQGDRRTAADCRHITGTA